MLADAVVCIVPERMQIFYRAIFYKHFYAGNPVLLYSVPTYYTTKQEFEIETNFASYTLPINFGKC